MHRPVQGDLRVTAMRRRGCRDGDAWRSDRRRRPRAHQWHLPEDCQALDDLGIVACASVDAAQSRPDARSPAVDCRGEDPPALSVLSGMSSIGLARFGRARTLACSPRTLARTARRRPAGWRGTGCSRRFIRANSKLDQAIARHRPKRRPGGAGRRWAGALRAVDPAQEKWRAFASGRSSPIVGPSNWIRL